MAGLYGTCPKPETILKDDFTKGDDFGKRITQ